MERLSGLDAMFLYLETSNQPANVCCVVELDPASMDGGYSRSVLREALASRLSAVPELRQKVADSQLNFDHPVWVDDPSFNVDRHIFEDCLLRPGGREELASVCARIAAQPLSRDRPLWQLWILENAEKPERVTLLLKAHHALVDGVGGANLMGQLCSPDLRAPAPDRVPHGLAVAGAARIAASGAVGLALRPWRLATIVPATGLTVMKTLRRARTGQSMAAPFTAPSTSFNAPFSDRRNVALTTLDLDDIKKVKNRFGVTVNDVVLTLCAGALREFLSARDELPDGPLVAAVPVSVHGESDRPGRNQTSWMFCSLHTEIADPIERLRSTSSRAAVAKQHSADLGATLLQDWAQLVGNITMSALMRLVSRIPKPPKPAFNLILSNVAGPPMQLYIAGCAITMLYPLGPILMGSALNITVMSYNGAVGVGMISCPDLLPDLGDLADAFPAALKTLLAADGNR